MALIDDLEAKVSAEVEVDTSVISLLGNIAQKLKDAGTDPVRLQAVIDALTTEQQRLADAVTANTPAA